MTISSTVGGIFVDGNQSKFREHYWRTDGVDGGLDRFELFQQIDPDTPDRDRLGAVEYFGRAAGQSRSTGPVSFTLVGANTANTTIQGDLFISASRNLSAWTRICTSISGEPGLISV
ncbi:MAG: hypothetical protein U1G07_03790 [Verrucomicrobiota bacterium]